MAILFLKNDWVKVRAEEQERAFQNVASELAVLKLQISPHFVVNTPAPQEPGSMISPNKIVVALARLTGKQWTCVPRHYVVLFF